MKMKTVPVLILSICASVTALAAPSHCEQKFAGIEAQIEYAKKNGNYHRVQGLEKALLNAKKNCSTASLIEDKEKDIGKQQEKINQTLEKIQKGRQDGNLDKVHKLEEKLRHEQEKHGVLQNELRDLES